MKILVVEPGKHPYTQEIRDDLASMQAVVGGLIQAVYPFEEQVALICNEEGKLLSLPPNRVLRDDNEHIYDVICGTFFLCAAPTDSDAFEGLNLHLPLAGAADLFVRIHRGDFESGTCQDAHGFR